MKIEYLFREEAVRPIEVLAEFLKKVIAVAKYGKTRIFEGDVYYLPYAMLTYQIAETGEKYVFLDSRLCEDVSVFRQGGEHPICIREMQAEEDHVLEAWKTDDTVCEEIEKKIKMNKKMRKMFVKFHFEEMELRTVYLPEQSFYVKGKSEYLFLVDGLLGKVDFKHLQDVEKKFAENYLKSRCS